MLVKTQLTIVGMSLGSHSACLAYTKSWAQISTGHTVDMVHRVLKVEANGLEVLGHPLTEQAEGQSGL